MCSHVFLRFWCESYVGYDVYGTVNLCPPYHVILVLFSQCSCCICGCNMLQHMVYKIFHTDLRAEKPIPCKRISRLNQRWQWKPAGRWEREKDVNTCLEVPLSEPGFWIHIYHNRHFHGHSLATWKFHGSGSYWYILIYTVLCINFSEIRQRGFGPYFTYIHFNLCLPLPCDFLYFAT